jgi:hypothetical protein
MGSVFPTCLRLNLLSSTGDPVLRQHNLIERMRALASGQTVILKSATIFFANWVIIVKIFYFSELQSPVSKMKCCKDNM